MKPAPFDYSRPETVEEALAVLADLGDDGKVLAGGQSLLPLLSMRLAAPKHLVDINRLQGLAGIDVGSAGVRIGALVRHAQLERDAATAGLLPVLGQALRSVAHPTIRNRGTSLGSIVHADPAAELPTLLAVLGGSVRIRSVSGQREVPASEFFLGPLESAVRAGEIAESAYFPALPVRHAAAFEEVSRRRGDYAICGVAAVVGLDEDLRVRSVRAGLLSMAGTPLVLDLSEALAGSRFDADLSAAGALARELVDPEPDLHATADYRRQLAQVLTTRTVRRAAWQAAGLEADAA